MLRSNGYTNEKFDNFWSNVSRIEVKDTASDEDLDAVFRNLKPYESKGRTYGYFDGQVLP